MASPLARPPHHEGRHVDACHNEERHEFIPAPASRGAADPLIAPQARRRLQVLHTDLDQLSVRYGPGNWARLLFSGKAQTSKRYWMSQYCTKSSEVRPSGWLSMLMFAVVRGTTP
jgi:hypothetical protein